MALKQFNQTAGRKPYKSAFDLSHEVKLTCDMGQLVPILTQQVMPGDVFDISQNIIVRMQPMVAPVLHGITVRTHTFFVPHRIINDNFEKFITGDENGEYSTPLPVAGPGTNGVGGLADYLGWPVGVNIPSGSTPLSAPVNAYNLIWNEYFRDQNVQAERASGQTSLAYVNWGKDYFTTALPFQQRGTAPALPITGTISATWDTVNIINGSPTTPVNLTAEGSNPTLANLYVNDPDAKTNMLNFFNNNEIDLSAGTTFNIADLRQAAQIQRFLELNARGGVRYTEFIEAHFGIKNPDSRMQRPEFIGGTKAPLIMSEVLQTSESTASSPQGNLAGHGITVASGRAGKYRVPEFGIIMTLLSIRPDTGYSQGINRQWLWKTRYDWPFPEFVHLSEQAVEMNEIYTTNVDADNHEIFGFQGRYNELRYIPNSVHGLFRTTLNYWHLSREFSTPPALNDTFLKCDGTTTSLKRIFAVQDEPGFLVAVGNIIKAVRPIPVVPNPGLMDH